jgi:hypothetical protein
MLIIKRPPPHKKKKKKIITIEMNSTNVKMKKRPQQ